MRSFLITTAAATLLGLTGCSGPLPDVATAYNNLHGKVKTSRFTACPTIEGVWHLGNLSAGSMKLEDNQLIQHFRWFAPYLFGLSANTQSYVALEPRPLQTVLYLSPKIPGAAGRSMVSFSELTEAQMPCVGHGWRRVARHPLRSA